MIVYESDVSSSVTVLKTQSQLLFCLTAHVQVLTQRRF